MTPHSSGKSRIMEATVGATHPKSIVTEHVDKGATRCGDSARIALHRPGGQSTG